eukprot:445172-Amphidinium_carterae.2
MERAAICLRYHCWYGLGVSGQCDSACHCSPQNCESGMSHVLGLRIWALHGLPDNLGLCEIVGEEDMLQLQGTESDNFARLTILDALAGTTGNDAKDAGYVASEVDKLACRVKLAWPEVVEWGDVRWITGEQ